MLIENVRCPSCGAQVMVDHKLWSVGTVRLRELIRDFRHMEPRVSHYSWGDFIGFVSLNRFAVETVEGRRLVFDVTTGKQVADQPREDRRSSDRPSPKSRQRRRLARSRRRGSVGTGKPRT